MLGTLLDTPAPLRRFLLERFFTRGLNVAALVADDRALAEFIRANVFGVWHASGTCRMGDVRDRDAVTDAEGCVHGAKGLRVVDASLMPRLPSANTNIPTIMIAEKIADAMIAARRASAASGTRSADGAPSASGPSPLAAAH